MAWNKLSNLVTRQHTRRGLAPSIAAGMICQQAESLYPGLFKAVSLKNGLLTVALPTAERLNFKLIEGALLAELARYAESEKLPVPQRIRLTNSLTSDRL